jgi:predicted phage terminase large subunit-like protein
MNKDDLKKALKIELARREFWAFCTFYDPEFYSKRAFLKDVATAFQQIETGDLNAISVSMPPRAGKSYITSLFCAWVLGRNPAESVMRNACTATLYLKFSYDVRAVVKSDKFKMVFPEVTLSDDKANLQGWNTNKSKQVGYFGAGVGGTIIGFGATKIGITDDLYRGIEDALSDTINDRIIQWKESTHDSRFESGCKRIDIGTRWSINDVIGRNIDSGIYDKSIIISAMTDADTSFCEDVMTTDEYREKRKRMTPEIWSAEYLQNPVDIKGRLYDHLKRITQTEFNQILQNNAGAYDGTIGYVDVADAGKDYTAMAICAIIKKELYVIDYVFNRENTDVTLPLCAEMLNKYNVPYCRVESNAMGAMFARQLQRMTPNTRIMQVNNTTNKDTRIIMQSAFIQNRFTFVTGSKYSELFLSNVESYSKEGKNKNDDAPDCLAGLSIFTQSMFKIIM